jgi:hypothetical protein
MVKHLDWKSVAMGRITVSEEKCTQIFIPCVGFKLRLCKHFPFMAGFVVQKFTKETC